VKKTFPPYITIPPEAAQVESFVFSQNNHSLSENNGLLSSYNLELDLTIKCRLAVVQEFDRAIIPQNCTVSAVLVWRCLRTRQRGAGVRTQISSSTISLECTVPREAIAGSLWIQVQIVLNESAPVGMPGHAKYAGSILWTGDAKDLVIDGTGGRFPVELLNNGSMGNCLWRLVVRGGLIDDSLAERVALQFNVDHPIFPSIEQNPKGNEARILIPAVVSVLLRTAINEEGIDEYLSESVKIIDNSYGACVQYLLSLLNNKGVDVSVVRNMIANRPSEFEELLGSVFLIRPECVKDSVDPTMLAQ